MAKHKLKVKRSNDAPISNLMERYHFEDEHDAIQNFFSWYEIEEAKELLYELFRCWIVSDNIIKIDSHGRDRVVFFYEQLCIVIEASLLLEQKRLSKGAKVHYTISPSEATKK